MNCELYFKGRRKKKQNWNNQRIGRMNSDLFNKEFVSSFFQLNMLMLMLMLMFCDSRR